MTNLLGEPVCKPLAIQDIWRPGREWNKRAKSTVWLGEPDDDLPPVLVGLGELSQMRRFGGDFGSRTGIRTFSDDSLEVMI